MKKLELNQMENVEGGAVKSLDGWPYCMILSYWLMGGSGYQGDTGWLSEVWKANC